MPGVFGRDTRNQDMQVNALYFDLSFANALTALAGGAQAGTPLTKQVSLFTVVASAADSAQLPAAKAGRWRVVINADASDAMAIFPQTGEFINALTVDSSFSLSANKVVIFFCAVDGTWNSNLTA